MEINGKNYTMKYGLRPMFIFESMTDKPFSITTMFDTYVFFYACLVADPGNPALEFGEFLDYCDEHPESINEFNTFLEAERKRKDTLSPKKKERKGRTSKS